MYSFDFIFALRYPNHVQKPLRDKSSHIDWQDFSIINSISRWLLVGSDENVHIKVDSNYTRSYWTFWPLDTVSFQKCPSILFWNWSLETSISRWHQRIFKFRVNNFGVLIYNLDFSLFVIDEGILFSLLTLVFAKVRIY